MRQDCEEALTCKLHLPLLLLPILNIRCSSPTSLPLARFLLFIMMLSFRLLSSVLFVGSCFAQTTALTGSSPSPTVVPIGANSTQTTTTSTSSSAADASSPPDVYLSVPELHVGKIELDVDNLSADSTIYPFPSPLRDCLTFFSQFECQGG